MTKILTIDFYNLQNYIYISIFQALFKFRHRFELSKDDSSSVFFAIHSTRIHCTETTPCICALFTTSSLQLISANLHTIHTIYANLNFTLIRCVHFSIERMRPLFRVKWRLFSQTTQHVLVLSNSSKAIMILIALSDSWHRLLHFQCSDWVTQFTEVLLDEFFFTITLLFTILISNAQLWTGR